MGLIPFGKITKIHGVKGELKILPYSKHLDNLLKLERIFIQKKHDEKINEFRISNIRPHNESSIVELAGVESIEDAIELRGSTVMVEKSDLSQPQENEYYWFQLIGLSVYTKEGIYVGKVINLIDREPQNLLIVKNKNKEALIPMVDSIVDDINLEESKVIIAPIEGLLD